MPFRCLPARLLLAGFALFAAIPAGATAFDPRVERGAPAALYAAYTAEAADRFRIPRAWIEAVLHVESAGNPRAVSAAGAMGLMQVMPGTWASLRDRYRLGPDPFEPRDNILAGAGYLREMFDRYGDVAAMLAAYNAGPDRTDAYLDFGRPLPAETRAYVAAIAPMLGIAPLPGGTARRPPPSNWRTAPLFVARSAEAPGGISEGGTKPGGGGEAVDTKAANIRANRTADAAEPAHRSPTPEIFVSPSNREVRR